MFGESKNDGVDVVVVRTLAIAPGHICPVVGLPGIFRENAAVDQGLGDLDQQTGPENRAEDGEYFVKWIDGHDEPAGHTGERRSEVAKRAVSVIEKETQDFSGTLVLVTHGGTARCLLGSILRLPMPQWGVIGGLSNACWSVLELTQHHGDSRWYLAEHNAGSLPEPVFGDDAVN